MPLVSDISTRRAIHDSERRLAAVTPDNVRAYLDLERQRLDLAREPARLELARLELAQARDIEAARDEAEMEDRRRRACARVIVRRLRPST